MHVQKCPLKERGAEGKGDEEGEEREKEEQEGGRGTEAAQMEPGQAGTEGQAAVPMHRRCFGGNGMEKTRLRITPHRRCTAVL